MVCHIVIGITMILTPFLKYIGLLYAEQAVNGFVSGGIELMANVWTVEMWGNQCGPYVQAVHFGGSIAGLITAPMFGPFLMKHGHQVMSGNVTRHVVVQPSTIYIPYAILGGLSVLFG